MSVNGCARGTMSSCVATRTGRYVNKCYSRNNIKGAAHSLQGRGRVCGVSPARRSRGTEGHSARPWSARLSLQSAAHYADVSARQDSASERKVPTSSLCCGRVNRPVRMREKEAQRSTWCCNRVNLRRANMERTDVRLMPGNQERGHLYMPY